MAKYSGSEWVQGNIHAKGQQMSQLGKDVADLLGELFYGIYHISPKSLSKVDWSNPHWVEITIGYKDFSTTDFDDLTRLVFLAHHTAIRVSLDAVARQHIRLIFHRRERVGHYSSRHPYLDEAVKRFKDNVSLPEYDKDVEPTPAPQD
jgi:hypothetical protein